MLHETKVNYLPYSQITPTNTPLRHNNISFPLYFNYSCSTSVLFMLIIGYNRKICQHGNNTGSYMDQELADIVRGQWRLAGDVAI